MTPEEHSQKLVKTLQKENFGMLSEYSGDLIEVAIQAAVEEVRKDYEAREPSYNPEISCEVPNFLGRPMGKRLRDACQLFQSRYREHGTGDWDHYLAQIIQAAVEEEREACAQIAIESICEFGSMEEEITSKIYCEMIAEKIRAREEKR